MESLPQNNSSKIKSNFFSLSTLALISFFVMVFVMGLLKIYSPDLGFHLKSAQWMLQNKRFIYTDSFSFGAQGLPYFDLQWLYQLLIYSLYKKGEATLVIVNALLITCSLILVWFRFIKNTGIANNNIKMGIFAFISLLLVQPLSFEIRPHVLSWIYLNFLLLFLESYKRNGNKRFLYLLPLIMLMWVNSHSLAIIGLVIIAIYNTGYYLEKRKLDKRFLLFSIFCLVAFIINPYLFEGLLYPFKQLGIISGNNLFKSYIGEFQSPFTYQEILALGSKYFTSPLLLIHVSAAFSLFSIFRSLMQKQFTDALLLTAFLIVLYLGHKNYGYFLMVSLPLIIKYAFAWFEARHNKKQVQKISPTAKNKTVQAQIQVSLPPAQQAFYKRLSIAAVILAILISITSITDGYQIFRTSPYRFGVSSSKDDLPIEATAFLLKNNIKGKLLNHLDYGGYLMYHYNEKVYIDGRLELMENDFFKTYYESVTERNGFKKLLDAYNPDIVIFPYVKARAWWLHFISTKNQSGYKPVYFDGLSVIYLKSSAFPQFAEIAEKDIMKTIDPTAYMRINESIETSKPGRFVVLINGLWQKQSFSITNQNKATYCFTNGFDSAAISYSVMGIENSTVRTPNIFKNLSLYFKDKKMYNEAQLCEDKSDGSN